MHNHYQSPWFVEALEKEKNLKLNELNANLSCDICIVGGGFTGLWTAIKIKEKKPHTNIILIEKDLCGSGASGRNGGCMIPQSTKFQGIRDVVGVDDAKQMVLSTEAAVKHIKDFCFENEINAEIRDDGVFYGATNKFHQGSFESLIKDLNQHKINSWERLSKEKVQDLTKSKRFIDGYFSPIGGSLQPALLVRGLKKVAEESTTGEGIAEYLWYSTILKTIVKYRAYVKKIETDTYVVSYERYKIEQTKVSEHTTYEIIERISIIISFLVFLFLWYMFVDSTDMHSNNFLIFYFICVVSWFVYNAQYKMDKLKNKDSEEDKFLFKEGEAIAIGGISLSLALFLKEMLSKHESSLQNGNKLLAISFILVIAVIFDPVVSTSSTLFRIKYIIKHHILTLTMIFIGVSIIFSVSK